MLINFYKQFCNLRNTSKSMISLPKVPLFGLYAYLLNITVITLLHAGTDLIRSACEMYATEFKITVFRDLAEDYEIMRVEARVLLKKRRASKHGTIMALPPCHKYCRALYLS